MIAVSLPHRQQLRNVAIYAITNCLIYLSAPVVYVGITQTSLCASLGASDTVSNLPSSAFFWATLVPVFIAARFHKVSLTAPVLVSAYALTAASGLLVAASLYWPVSTTLRLVVVVFYGGAIGAGMGVRNVFIWEVVNRGISQDLRGWAYSLSFGLGPLFAVLGSLIAQLLLAGKVAIPSFSLSAGFSLAHFEMSPLSFPLNFAALFAATAPILALAALLASQFKLPEAFEETSRVGVVANVIESVAELMRDRILALAILAYMLVEAGFTITNNMSLYTMEILHRPAEEYAGYQNALRFSFKAAAGFALGWLLVRTHAKQGVLVTGAFCLAGILWAIAAPASWFLVSFGLMGAGELYGTYYSNYIMARSRPQRLRQNMAMLQLLNLATSLAPAGFGALSDAYGLPMSFVAASGIVCTSLLLVAFGLPPKPTPPVFTEVVETLASTPAA